MNAATQRVVVFSGPSGSGKNSVLDGVLKECAACTRLVTATTRAPREGEVHGVDHYFFTKDEFHASIARGEILEHWHARGTDRYYGTYLPDLKQKLSEGKTVLAEMEVQGMRFLKQQFGALAIFIMAESYEELERRIRERDPRMSESAVRERLEIAHVRVAEHAPEYDYRVVNYRNKLDKTIAEVMDILCTESMVSTIRN